MLKHKEIWNAIDKLAQINGMTPSGLAKKSGLDATIFNKSKRISKDGRGRWPTTESISQILTTTRMSMGQFADLIKNNNKIGRLELPKIKINELQNNESFISSTGIMKKEFREKRLNSTEIDGDSFIIQINSNDYSGFYNKGDELIVTLTDNIRRGDKVIIAMKNDDNLVCLLKKRTTYKIILESLDGTDTYEIENRNIKWIARILWKSQ